MSLTKFTKVIAITGGKGGVGKTNIAINLSMSLSDLGQKVLLLDADFGLSNIDILLGVKPRFSVNDLLFKNCKLQDLIINGPNNIEIISGASGNTSLCQLNANQCSGLISAFDDIYGMYDYLIVDTATGIGQLSINLAAASNEIVIVVCRDPSSLADSYALIKLLFSRYRINKFRIVVNMSSSWCEARQVYTKLNQVTEKYLGVILDLLGWIPMDAMVQKAISTQEPFLTKYPGCIASSNINELAKSITKLNISPEIKATDQFFHNKIIGKCNEFAPNCSMEESNKVVDVTAVTAVKEVNHGE